MNLRNALRSEDTEQINVIAWADWNAIMYPELRWLHHIPNGGSRNKAEAANLKRQGVKAGVPDLFLPVARGGYHGLYIELKYGKNKTSKNQDKWLSALSKQGYCSMVCYGWVEAKKAICEYLKGENYG